MVRLINQKAMNIVVSHHRDVQSELDSVQRRVHGNASRRLAMHRHAGQASVTMTDGGVDRFVNLEDPAALSIEFGHWVKGKFETDTPKFVPGLYILGTAAGTAG